MKVCNFLQRCNIKILSLCFSLGLLVILPGCARFAQEVPPVVLKKMDYRPMTPEEKRRQTESSATDRAELKTKLKAVAGVPAKDMSLSNLLLAKEYAIALGQLEDAATYLERILIITEDQQILKGAVRAAATSEIP